MSMNGTGFGRQERNSDKIKGTLETAFAKTWNDLATMTSAPDWDSGETGSSLLLQTNLVILLQLRFLPP